MNEVRDGGLTDFGYDAVIRMNKAGILIDVAHTGDATAKDTIEASKDPIIISHRGSRSLIPDPTVRRRMTSDEVLKACAEKGGVLGLEVAGFGLRTEKHPEPSIEGFLEQMEYCIDLIGIDHVGVGPDTPFSDKAEGYRAGGPGARSGHYERPHPEGAGDFVSARTMGALVEGIDCIRGLESLTDFPNVIRGLIRDGYSDLEIAKVVGGNGLRLLREVL